MLYVDANTSRMLYPRIGNMEGMDLPNHRWSLPQPKHGMKGSDLGQQSANNTPNEFIKIYNVASLSIPV